MVKKIVGCVALVLMLGVGSSATAAPSDQPENVYVPKDRTFAYNYWHAGASIDLSGTFEKDVYIAGNTVTIDGHVMGDVIGFANTLRITGTVDGNVRFAAQSIVINGEVKKNVMVAANSIMIDQTGKVGGELMAAGSSVDINGPVSGNVTITSANATINSAVQGTVWANARLALREKADIAGDVTYVSDRVIDQSAQAMVKGTIMQKPLPVDAPATRVTWAEKFLMWFFSLGRAMVLVLFGFWLVPKLFVFAKDEMVAHPGRDIGIGLLIVINTLLVSVLIMFTLIGVTLGFLGMLWYVVVLLVAKTAISYGIGWQVLTWMNVKEMPHQLWVMIGGVTVMAVITAIPFIGGVLNLVFVCLGVGVLVVTTKNQVVKPLRAS